MFFDILIKIFPRNAGRHLTWARTILLRGRVGNLVPDNVEEKHDRCQ